MTTDAAATPPSADIESASSRADSLSISGFASSPILRPGADGKVLPLAEIVFYGDDDAVILQRQLTVFQLTSIAEGLINASVDLLSTCQEQIQPKKGWVLPISDIEAEIAGVQQALQSLHAQLRTIGS